MKSHKLIHLHPTRKGMLDANQETYNNSSRIVLHAAPAMHCPYDSLYSFRSSRPIPHQLVEPPLNCNYSEVTLPWQGLDVLFYLTNGSSLCRHALQALLATCLELKCQKFRGKGKCGWLVRTSVPSECATFRKSPEMVQATTCLNIEISHLIKHSSNVIEAQQFLYTSILSSAPSRQGHHSCRRTSCTF